MKITGYFIPHSDEKLAFVRLGAVQNQISGSEDIDSDAHTELLIVRSQTQNILKFWKNTQYVN